MSTFSAFPFRRAWKALAPVVLIAAGWFAQQQGIAATGNLNAAPCLEATSRLLGSPSPTVLDRPGADRCVLTGDSSIPVAKTRKPNATAAADYDTPAGAPNILPAAGGFNREARRKRQHSTSDRGIETGYPAAFQSRAPPTPNRR